MVQVAWKYSMIILKGKSLMLLKHLDSPDDRQNILMVSIGAALLNTVPQLSKMIMEAKELDEDILDYL